MSAKVNVIGENRTIKRTTALTLICKQIYEWEVHNSSVKRRPLSDGISLKPAFARPRGPAHYEHHIEPRIVQFTQANSSWMRYLQGYGAQA